MAIIFSADTPWILPENPALPVKKALRDLRNDWYSVFGAPPVYENVRIGPRLIIGGPCPQSTREGFDIRVQDDAVILTGADDLGLIYALYTFSKKILGVDPFYWFCDFLPQKKQKIAIDADFSVSNGSPAFQYRGFFINNEDMITGSFPDPMDENIMDLGMFDRICEVILRLKGNMIVPGTRTYPDETTRDLANRRGLYVNDHHVTPLGLNVYMWPEDLPYSYVTHPEVFDDLWEKCVRAQAHRKMLWTVGFRGRGDESFWNVDKNAPATEQERANIINRAVQKQVDLIRAVQPEADIIFNMYEEQAQLCAKGLLKVPEGVMRVWPNDGAGVMSDRGRVQKGDGAYYHITACRNRFAEAVSPQRIYEQLGRYVKAGATSCMLVNVGNIRHFPLSLTTLMNFVYDPEPFMQQDPETQMEKTVLDFAKKHYDCRQEDIAQVYLRFLRCSNFRAPRPDRAPYGYGAKCLGLYAGMWDADQNQVLIDFRQNLYMHEICRGFIRVLKGEMCFNEDWRLTVHDFEAVLHEPDAYLPELANQAQALFADVPERSKAIYRLNLLAPIRMTNGLNNCQSALDHAVLAYMDGDKTESIHLIKQAIAYLETGINALHETETAKWPHWFSYEALSCYWHTRDLLRAVLALLMGEACPPVRPFIDFEGHKRQIAAYQYERGSKNFPFLNAH